MAKRETFYVNNPIEVPGNGLCYVIPKSRLSEGVHFIRNVANKENTLGIYPVSDEDLQQYFYNIVASSVEFVKEFNFDIDIFDRSFALRKDLSFELPRQLTDTEVSFLYNFVKKISPEKVLEFSCGSGGSTVTISKALIDSGKKPIFFETHDIEESCINMTKKTLADNNIDFVKLKLGDALDTLDREKLKEVDFLFVDSDHEREFSKRYVDEFLPLLKKDCWVAVHDMRFHNDYITPETSILAEYLFKSKNNSFFYMADLMKMFGITCLNDKFEHCGRNTLFFFKV